MARNEGNVSSVTIQFRFGPEKKGENFVIYCDILGGPQMEKGEKNLTIY